MTGVIVGTIGVVTIAGQEITVDSINVDPVNETGQDKSTTARGRIRHYAGFSGYTITGSGHFDTIDNPVQTARNVRAGQVLTNFTWQLSTAPLLRFLAASSVVKKCTVKDVAEGRADIDWELTVDGILKFPGEA